MSGGDVAHPLIVAFPRLVPPAGPLLRWAALRKLRSLWASGRLDLVIPSGELVRLGGAGVAEARAHIRDDRFFLRTLLRGEIGAGESFVAGEWDADDLVAALRVFLRGTSGNGVESPLTRVAQLPALARHRRAANSRTGSERNIHAHYDLGNSFYRLFLDEQTLAYSCAIFDRNAHRARDPHDAAALAAAQHRQREQTLDSTAIFDRNAHRARDPHDAAALAAAQHRKHERLCELLALSPRDHLLEIGCGWGGMAIHAARTRGCRVTAITVSREQHELAARRVAEAGVADRVTIEYRDYRDLAGTYDKVVSIEMIEAVGFEYLTRFFDICARVLAPGGRLALQTITMPDDRFDSYRRRVDWMQTYIFPGSCIPSIAVLRASAPQFTLADANDIGPDYAPTLRMWRERFVARLADVRALGFDEPFIRTWLLYLAFSEAAFAERTLGDHQLLFTPR